LKNIIILGAGYAGILTAKKLAKKLGKNEDVKISIIDKNSYHTMLTELHEVAANRVDEESIRISLKKIFAGRNVDVILDSISKIDFENKSLVGEENKYSYDYLVLSAGSKPTYFGTKGAEEFAYKLWSYDDAIILKNRIHDMFRLAASERNIEKKKKMLTFYIVGAGFTGIELVGELAEYVPTLCDKFEIERNLVTICDVDVLPRAVPILPEKLSAKVERRLIKMGVTLKFNTSVVGIGEDFIELKSNDVVTKYSAGTVVWTAGIESSDVTKDAATVLESAGRGRIKVDKYLRTLERQEVYVVGDNMMYIAEGETIPVPQMVENCEQSADIAAHNLISAITGKKEMIEYKPSFHGVMVCVGGRFGVARVGLPNKMINLPSFFAMFVKHFINIIYFMQVLGWNKVFSYVKHEFFTIRKNRSFVGGHFSNKTPSFLLVPLRIWLGAVWLFEGILKINEGWLNSPKLQGFFGGAKAWFDGIVYGADAVASSTQAAGEVMSSGTAIFSINILGLFDAIFVSGKSIVESKIADYAFKINMPLMNWFTDNVILSSESMQIFMQCTIVVIEILIGLALIGGLFTMLSSGVSLILQVMFVATTGLYLSTFWMIFAGLAVLIGGGRILGLDYYVMPFLKRKWKKVGFAKKWYLYND
jgi:NADH dehydrogenase